MQEKGTPKKEREAAEAEEGRRAAKMAPQVRQVIENVGLQLQTTECESKKHVVWCVLHEAATAKFPR